MVNDLAIQKRSGNITTLSPRKGVSIQDKHLVEALVRTRLLQGWNLQSPGDAKLTASIWKKEFDRHKIKPELYDVLVDLAVDHRTKEIAQGKTPTSLTVELLIVCYYQYRRMKLEELDRINAQLEHYRSLRHRYQTNQLSLEDSVRQARFQEGTDHDNFMDTSEQIIGDLTSKKETFMEESGLSE